LSDRTIEEVELSNTVSPEEYLASLEPKRQEMVGAIRDVINSNIQAGFIEQIDFGMIAWVIPLERFPNTYNGHPTMYAALASQKQHVSLYLMAIYADADLSGWFQTEYAKLIRKPNMGKSCVRFRKMEDIPLDLIGEAIGKFSVDDYLELLAQHQVPAKSKRVQR
jgi:hypothetical protein